MTLSPNPAPSLSRNSAGGLSSSLEPPAPVFSPLWLAVFAGYAIGLITFFAVLITAPHLIYTLAYTVSP